MQKKADIQFQKNSFLLSGDLHYSNVMSIFQMSLPHCLTSSQLSFDFSQLSSSDSAGLALMLEWVKLAKQLNKPICFSHVSEEIMSIAKASGIEGMLSARLLPLA